MIADVAVREAPEMIRNDNGDLAGYIYVYLDGVTAPEYVERAQEYLRTRLTLAAGLFDGVDRAVSVRRRGAIDAARRRADHAGHHVPPAGRGVSLRRRQRRSSCCRRRSPWSAACSSSGTWAIR